MSAVCTTFPFSMFVRHGALDERVATPLEAAKSPGSAEGIEVAATFWRRTPFTMENVSGRSGAGSDQRGFLADGAVAIDAIDFDRGARLAVDFAVAVIVLREMAIVALHAFFEMNVGEVDGFRKTIGIFEGDGVSVFVEPIAFAIVIEDGAKNPAVSVKVGELGGF